MNLLRRTLLWTAAALGVMLVLAAIMVPRLINIDSVRTAIEGAISRDLGGTLTYDRVVLSIFPRPRVVLRKPKIQITQKVSAALNSLDIYPAIFPLLTGKLQVDDVHLGSPDVTVLLQQTPATVKQRKRPASVPGPSPEEVLAVAAKNMPGIVITIDNGVLTVVRTSQKILSVRNIGARIVFLPAQTGAGTTIPADQAFRVTGSAKCSVDAPGFPAGPFNLSVEEFEALPRIFTFSRVRGSVLDLTFSLSGSLDDYLSTARKADANLSGTAGPNTMLWLRDSVSLSPLLTLRSPLVLSNARVRWEQGGTLQAAGHAAVKAGPSVDFDVRLSSGGVSLKRLAVRDEESQALIALESHERVVEISFSGNLTQHTLDGLLEQGHIQFGWLKGDLKARLPLDHLADASADGMLESDQMVVPWKKHVPLMIDHLVLSVRGRNVTLDRAAMTLGKSKAVFTGGIEARKDGLVLDIDASSRDIEWNDLQDAFFSPEKKHEASKAEERTESKPRSRGGAFSVLGALRVDIAVLRGRRYAFETVRGTILFEQNGTRYDVREAKLCGISVAGSVDAARRENDLSLKISAKEQELGRTLTCLAGEDMKVSGTYDLSGDITGKGTNEGLLRTLQGPITFVSKNGRVYNDLLVVPILKYKKIADLLGDRTTDAKKDGIPYDTFGIRGMIAQGTLTVGEGVIKSPLMNLAAHGDIDMTNDRLDITVLMAPFRTVDAVVKKIPLLGNILGGTLVTVPLRVQGPFKDPKVTPLPPSAIGEGLLGIMRRTLEVPFQIVDDVSPRKRSAPTPSVP